MGFENLKKKLEQAGLSEPASLTRRVEVLEDLRRADEAEVELEHAKAWFHTLPRKRQAHVMDAMDDALNRGDWHDANAVLLARYRKATRRGR